MASFIMQDVRLGVAVISLCAVLGLVIWTRVRPAVSLLDFSCFSPSSRYTIVDPQGVVLSRDARMGLDTICLGQ